MRQQERNKSAWRHSNLWSHYDPYVVEQYGALFEITWEDNVTLFEQNRISWFKKISVLSLCY